MDVLRRMTPPPHRIPRTHRRLLMEELEPRAAPVVLAPGQLLQFTDADGDLLRVEFTGAGSAQILDGSGSDPNFSNIGSITFSGTNLTSSLIVQDMNPGIGGDTIQGGTIRTAAGEDVGLVALGVLPAGGTAGLGAFGSVNVGGSLGALLISGDYDADLGGQTIRVGRSLGLLSVRNLTLNSATHDAGIYKTDAEGDVSFIQIAGTLYNWTNGPRRSSTLLLEGQSTVIADDAGGSITIIPRNGAISVLAVPMPGGGQVISAITSKFGTPDIAITTRGRGGDITEIESDIGGLGNIRISGAADTDVYRLRAIGNISSFSDTTAFGDVYDVSAGGTMGAFTLSASGRLGVSSIIPPLSAPHGLRAADLRSLNVGEIRNALVSTGAGIGSISVRGAVTDTAIVCAGTAGVMSFMGPLLNSEIRVESSAVSLSLRGPVLDSRISVGGSLAKLALNTGMSGSTLEIAGTLKSGTVKGSLTANADVTVLGPGSSLAISGSIHEGARLNVGHARVKISGDVNGAITVASGFTGGITLSGSLVTAGSIVVPGPMQASSLLSIKRDLAGTIEVDGDLGGRLSVGGAVATNGYLAVNGNITQAGGVSVKRGLAGIIVADAFAPSGVKYAPKSTGLAVQRTVPVRTFSFDSFETSFMYSFRGYDRSIDALVGFGSSAALYLLDPLEGLADLAVIGSLWSLFSDSLNFRDIRAGASASSRIMIFNGNVAGLLSLDAIGTSGSVLVGGDLNNLSVAGVMAGDIGVEGELHGLMDLRQDVTGAVRIDGDISPAGTIRVGGEIRGDIAIGGSLLGAVSTGARVSGTIDVGGNVANANSATAIHIGGDLTSAAILSIGGAQSAGAGAGKNRISITGTVAGTLSAAQFGDVVIAGEWVGIFRAGSPGIGNTLWSTFVTGGTLDPANAFAKIVGTGRQFYLTPDFGEATFNDSDGDLVRIRYQGDPGSNLLITLTGDTGRDDIAAIAYNNASAASNLSIAVIAPLGNGWAKAGRINAPGQTFGSISVQGSIVSLTGEAIPAQKAVTTRAGDTSKANIGDVFLSGNLAGTLDVGGSLTGTLTLGGDLTGSVKVGSDLGSVSVFGFGGATGNIEVARDLTDIIAVVFGSITTPLRIGRDIAISGGVMTGNDLAGVELGGGMYGVINAGRTLGPVTMRSGSLIGSINAATAAGDIVVGGAMDGAVLTTQDMTGNLIVQSGNGLNGIVLIGRDLTGRITADSGGIPGDILIGRDIAGAGLISCATSLTGTIAIGGGIRGNARIAIGGGVDGSVQIAELIAEQGRVSVGGNLGTSGAVAVGGLSSTHAAGAIAIGGSLLSTQPLPLRVGTAGVAAGSAILIGGSVQAETTIQVDGPFQGLLHVGTSGAGVFGRVVILHGLSDGTLKAFARSNQAVLITPNPTALTYQTEQPPLSGHDYEILFGLLQQPP